MRGERSRAERQTQAWAIRCPREEVKKEVDGGGGRGRGRQWANGGRETREEAGRSLRWVQRSGWERDGQMRRGSSQRRGEQEEGGETWM